MFLGTKMKKILIIDNSPTDRENLSLILTLKGFMVLEAGDGHNGMQLIEEEFPDLIITSIYLPFPDGFTIYKSLRKSAVTANIPFIFTTTMLFKGDLRRIREIGSEYLLKPVNPDLLVKKVNNIFRFIKLKSFQAV
jgi:CheY-like chemotaxis protein